MEGQEGRKGRREGGERKERERRKGGERKEKERREGKEKERRERRERENVVERRRLIVLVKHHDEWKYVELKIDFLATLYVSHSVCLFALRSSRFGSKMLLRLTVLDE